MLFCEMGEKGFTMLLGTYTCRLDSKGRVQFPAGLLRQLAAEDADGGFVLKQNEHASCLVAYTRRAFEEMARGLREEYPRHSKDGDRSARKFYSSANPVELDKTNRLLISRSDLDYAGLEGDVLFVGQYDCIEIWEPAAYAKALEE